MFEMDTLTIKQAARITGKDEKTVRRWITHQKRVPVLRDRKGRYLIARADLERVIHEDEAITPLLDEDRIAALERRIEDLEKKVDELASAAQPPVRTVRPSRPSYESGPVQPQHVSSPSGLPDGLVSWSSFADLHGLPRSTVQKAVDTGRLAAVVGKWKVGKTFVLRALNLEGQAAFYRLYHDNQHFTPCADCPHSQR